MEHYGLCRGRAEERGGEREGVGGWERARKCLAR